MLNKNRVAYHVIFGIVIGTIILNAQSPLYSNKSAYPISMEKFLTAGIAIGDIDGDGDLDMVEANGRHWPQANYVYFNAENRRFSSRYKLEAIDRTSYTVRLIDVDNDKDLDIIQASDKMKNQIHLNNGKGQFGPALLFGNTASNTRGIELNDLNKDGAPDIVEVSRGTQNLIYLNDGKGLFPTMNGDGRNPIPIGSANDKTLSVIIEDMDNDGHMDMVVANRDGDPNGIMFGLGNMQFSDPIAFGSGSDDTRGLAVADMNQDGFIDIVTANIGTPNEVIINKGGRRFDLIYTFGNNNGKSYAVAAFDLDGDLDIDIVIGNRDDYSRVYLNNGRGKLTMNSEIGTGRNSTYTVAVGDMNGDQKPDIILGNSGDPNMVYYQMR